MDSVESYRPVVQSTTGDHEVLWVHLDTFQYIWIHLDTFVIVWIHSVHLHFDPAFDAYVLVNLVRVTRSCLAVQSV